MKFKNTITGNVLVVEDKETIALMEKSPTYEAVKEKPAKPPKDGKDGKDNGGETPPAE